jgi:hypothetical protein
LNVTPPPQQTKIVFGQCYTKSQTAITSKIYKLSIRKIYLKKTTIATCSRIITSMPKFIFARGSFDDK